jgi:PIN domain nuclease of toxin-antitoxin system
MGCNEMILLDTHVVLWDAYMPEKLSKKAQDVIDQEMDFIICDISFWEIAMLVQKGRIESIYPVDEMINSILKSRNYMVKSITPAIAKIYIDLEDEINKDPADRLIFATALAEKTSLITADNNLHKSSLIETIW